MTLFFGGEGGEEFLCNPRRYLVCLQKKKKIMSLFSTFISTSVQHNEAFSEKVEGGFGKEKKTFT